MDLTKRQRDILLRAAQDDEVLDLEDDGWHIRAAGTHVWLEDVLVPTWVEVSLGGLDDQPTTFARVEVSNEGPKLVELRLTAASDQRGIRQADIRAIEVRTVTEDVLAGLSLRVVPDDVAEVAIRLPDLDSPWFVDNLKVLQRARSGKATRTITPTLLQRVAEIYRANVHDRPTLAVQNAFMVSPRMASEYVQRARKAKLLPPTTAGKKKA